MKVARTQSQSPSAKRLAERKERALAAARREHGDDATIHAYYGDEFFAEVPRGKGLASAVVPIKEEE